MCLILLIFVSALLNFCYTTFLQDFMVSDSTFNKCFLGILCQSSDKSSWLYRSRGAFRETCPYDPFREIKYSTRLREPKGIRAKNRLWHPSPHFRDLSYVFWSYAFLCGSDKATVHIDDLDHCMSNTFTANFLLAKHGHLYSWFVRFASAPLHLLVSHRWRRWV